MNPEQRAWWLLPALMATLIFAEMLWRVFKQRRGYDFGSAAASFGVAAGHALSGVLTTAVVNTVYWFAWDLTPLRLPLNDGRTWGAGFVAVEFCYYWFHRWSHTIRWLWATHAVHHSAEELTLPAAVRLGWTGALSGGWLVFLPLILLGWHPTLVATLLGLNLIYQFLLHTEVIGRLGPIEWVFNTPSHHRVHHASNPRYLDKNFGGVLIVFDRWFGTFAREHAGDPCRYGLTTPLKSRNPLKLALNEWYELARDVVATRSIKAAIWLATLPSHKVDLVLSKNSNDIVP